MLQVFCTGILPDTIWLCHTLYKRRTLHCSHIFIHFVTIVKLRWQNVGCFYSMDIFLASITPKWHEREQPFSNSRRAFPPKFYFESLHRKWSSSITCAQLSLYMHLWGQLKVHFLSWFRHSNNMTDSKCSALYRTKGVISNSPCLYAKFKLVVVDLSLQNIS